VESKFKRIGESRNRVISGKFHRSPAIPQDKSVDILDGISGSVGSRMKEKALLTEKNSSSDGINPVSRREKITLKKN
jgi:hypothetical protein